MTFQLVETPEGTDVLLTGEWSQRAAATFIEGHADGLVLNYTAGFKEPDLSFLAGLLVRRLHILDRTVTDLSPVYGLAEYLFTLHVQSDPRATIELERLPSLKVLSADWQQVQGSIQFAPLLERLFLGHYSAPDLRALGALSSIISVVMKNYPRVQSLDGVEDMPWLVQLGVHLAKDLNDITALRRSPSPVLEILQLPSCRKIADVAPVASCASLRFFELSEGAEIPTVAPLAGLEGLERLYLYGSTKIADGDLGPIARLPRLRDFRIQNRRGYSPAVKEIQEAITRRG